MIADDNPVMIQKGKPNFVPGSGSERGLRKKYETMDPTEGQRIMNYNS